MQIGDFGLSRDLMDDNYYVSHGGKVPIKWTSPEVTIKLNIMVVIQSIHTYTILLFQTRL